MTVGSEFHSCGEETEMPRRPDRSFRYRGTRSWTWDDDRRLRLAGMSFYGVASLDQVPTPGARPARQFLVMELNLESWGRSPNRGRVLPDNWRGRRPNKGEVWGGAHRKFLKNRTWNHSFWYIFETDIWNKMTTCMIRDHVLLLTFMKQSTLNIWCLEIV